LHLTAAALREIRVQSHQPPQQVNLSFGGRIMEVLFFNAPEYVDSLDEDAHIVNPSSTQMIALLRRGSSYWGKDSGSGSLRSCKQEKQEAGGFAYEELEGRPGLIILFHEGHGFHFVYSPSNDEAPLASFDGSGKTERVVHYLGGERAYFPAQTFVSVSKAERIVREFIEAGKASDVVAWQSAAKLRCGDPDS
jgi:hypothetical protein